jgi:hypothetical protein
MFRDMAQHHWVVSPSRAERILCTNIFTLEYDSNASHQNTEAGYLVTCYHMPELHCCKSQTFEQVQCCHINQMANLTNTNANLSNPCCSSITMQLLFLYHNLWRNKWLQATNTNIKNCMGRISVQYCLEKPATKTGTKWDQTCKRNRIKRAALTQFHTAVAQHTSELLPEILYHLFNKLIHINKLLQ